MYFSPHLQRVTDEGQIRASSSGRFFAMHFAAHVSKSVGSKNKKYVKNDCVEHLLVKPDRHIKWTFRSLTTKQPKAKRSVATNLFMLRVFESPLCISAVESLAKLQE